MSDLHRLKKWLVLITAIIAFPQQLSAAPLLNVTVKDIFARTINTRGLTLVDWDGYLANPAIKFTVTAPTGAVMPASAVLSANNQRLYFDTPSSASTNGPSKTIQFTSTVKDIPVYISIFPDRDGLDEDYTLTIRLTDKNGSQSSTLIPIHIIDQDANSTPTFRIIADFSTDQSGFFQDPLKKTIIQQAADDWAYFINGTGLNSVAARSESTWIWGPNGWSAGAVGFTVTNSASYTGFLLYAYGIHTPEIRSGGEGSYGGGYQKIGTTQLPLRRSGGLEVETQGNYNTLGWFLTTGDNDWWVSGNYSEPNDLYSIAHHEIGHSIAFCAAYQRPTSAQTRGYFDDVPIVSYLGTTLPVDSVYHFAGIIDPASKRGCFGSEYNGTVLGKRWILTKLDLLALQAAGYTLRNTSALAPLSQTARAMPAGIIGKSYNERLQAIGGVPFYAWDLTSGTLPAGLTLDSFTGLISGTPNQAGSFTFTARVRDYSPGTPSASAAYTIDVQPDIAPPVISTVTLTPPMVAAGDFVKIEVTAADNVEVTHIKANGLPLAKTGDTWQGTIAAQPSLGSHNITITASDAANNTSTDTSATYRTARIVGLTNAACAYALQTNAANQLLFVIWGRVTAADASGAIVDDGSGHPVTISASSHTLVIGNYARARGILQGTPEHPTLASSPNLIVKVD